MLIFWIVFCCVIFSDKIVSVCCWVLFCDKCKVVVIFCINKWKLFIKNGLDVFMELLILFIWYVVWFVKMVVIKLILIELFIWWSVLDIDVLWLFSCCGSWFKLVVIIGIIKSDILNEWII